MSDIKSDIMSTSGRFGTIPNGFYALVGNDNKIDFYKIAHGQGKWSGFTFVSLLIGASGQFREQRLRWPQSRVILIKVEADILGAAQMFGQHTGICAMCGSPLTNAESLKFGIGPKCRRKF